MWRLGGLRFEASLGKKFSRPSQPLKAGHEAHDCHPTYIGIIKKR
jgi:hypothetical protein